MQARFSGIGRAVDHNAQAFAQNSSLIRRSEKRSDLFANGIESLAKLRNLPGKDERRQCAEPGFHGLKRLRILVARQLERRTLSP